MGFINPKSTFRSSYRGCDWYLAVYNIKSNTLYTNLPVKRDPKHTSQDLFKGKVEQTKKGAQSITISPSIKVEPLPNDPRFELVGPFGNAIRVKGGVSNFIVSLSSL